MAGCSQEGLRLEPNRPAQGSWASSHHNYEKISICCLSSPLGGIVIAAWAGWDRPVPGNLRTEREQSVRKEPRGGVCSTGPSWTFNLFLIVSISTEARFGSSYVTKRIPQTKLPYLSKHKMEISLHPAFELLIEHPTDRPAQAQKRNIGNCHCTLL